MISLLVAIIAFAGSATGSETAARLYNEANALYRAGHYAAAVERYEQALATGLGNARLHYNLGNAAFKADQLGRAIVAYERALHLDPGDEDARVNLALANTRKVDRVEPEEHNVVTRAATAVYRALGPGSLAVASSACLFGLALLGVVWLLRPLARTVCVSLGSALLVAGLLCLALLAAKIEDRNRPEAVIIVEAVDGRSGPGGEFLKVFTLHEGTKVGLERSEGPWIQVRLLNGIGGWLPISALTRL